MNEPRHDAESELVSFLHSVDVRAPKELHGRVAALVAERSKHTRRPWWIGSGARGGSTGSSATASNRRPLAVAALGAAVAALVVGLVIALSGGSGGLTVQRTAALALRPATLPAPLESSSRRAQLMASVDGVAFPYWEERFGWRSTGARTDRIDGRDVTTVFYADPRGRRIGYAIVAGSPAPSAGSGTTAWRSGVEYHFTKDGGGEVVAWLRGGHLCVIAGRGVGWRTLLRLASWDDSAVPA